MSPELPHRKFPPNTIPPLPPPPVLPGEDPDFPTGLTEGEVVVTSWVRLQSGPSYQDEFPINYFPHKCCLLPVPLLQVDKFASIQRHDGLWKSREV